MAVRKTNRLLPNIFQTDVNQKFLSATLDQLVTEPNLVNIYGYIGRKFSPTYKNRDSYLIENTADRQNYQLEPSIVIRDDNSEVNFLVNYSDLIDRISYYGGITDNQSRLFDNSYYSFDPKVSLDKFVNFTQYYWLPDGPDPVAVGTSSVDLTKTFTVSRDPSTNKYTFTSNGQIVRTLTFARGGTYTFELDQSGYPFWIQTELGVDGKLNAAPTVPTRSIYGVTNNGADTGTVIFQVPQADAQDRFTRMEVVANVDYATPIPYANLHNQLLSKFLDQYPQYAGITGNLDGKTTIFVDVDKWANVGEEGWTARGVYDEDGFQVDGFDAGEVVDPAKRYGIWRIRFVDGGAGDPIVKLTWVQDVALDEKVFIKYGIVNANREFYKEITGFFERVPVITSVQNKLYIQDGVDADIYNEISIVDLTGYTIDVENDIIGKVNYTSPNGIEFTSGLKIEFGNDVIPAAYQNKQFYVENVGDNIKLVEVDLCVTPEIYNDELAINYPLHKIVFNKAIIDTVLAGDTITVGSSAIVVDTEAPIGKNSIVTLSPVDAIRKGQTVSGPGIDAGTTVLDIHYETVFPDYVTIVRGSKDLNAWSRNNRWFHAAVITKTAEYNGQVPYFDQTLRAQRPIVQFEGDYLLYNYGRIGKRAIDILDTTTIDAFNQLEGEYYTTAFGVDLTQYPNGLRVLFANDQDPLVRDKIYVVRLVYTEADPITGEIIGDPQIKLTIAEDGDSEIHDSVVVKGGQYKGSQWHYDGNQWLASQQKTGLNQDPLFDIIDSTYTSFSEYENSSFAGNKVIGYKRNTSAPADKVLEFGLSYRNFGTQGDIEFQNYYDTDTFTYTSGSSTATKQVNTGFLAKIVDRSTLSFRNVWQKVVESSKQYQLLTFTYTDSNVFRLDVRPADEATIPYVKVFVNNKILTSSQWSLDTTTLAVTVTATLVLNDKVDILVYSRQVSKLGFYQVPLNLDLNSQNIDLSTVTLGQMRNHLIELSQNSKDLDGGILGYNNLRDIELKAQGGNILQHAAPIPYASLFLLDRQANLVDAVRYAQQEYTKFKNKFLELSTTLNGINPNNPIASVDLILTTINAVKNRSFPWYYSDMVPYGPLRSIVNDVGYTIFDPLVRTYEITNVFSTTTLSNQAVIIYLNGTQLILGRDYTFNTDRPAVTISDTIDLNVDDVLAIYEYSDTDGNYIPETPTKLGLYPRFIPEKFEDNTYRNTINVIRGHDGSLTPAFDDYRDNFLIELERRIYNNIKLADNNDWSILYNLLPGKFRDNDYTIQEVNQILSRGFLTWVGNNKLDYSTNNTFESNDLFSANYNRSVDRIDGEFLVGYWRGIYNYFYDTDSPHLRPWEMLGFSVQPSWWENYYGPAPYTGGNKLLWDDLEAGRIVDGERAGIDLQFARPGLAQVIPVDEHGNLKNPAAVLVDGFNSAYASGNWVVGDWGPVETAWRRSSDYPFALQVALAVSKPAKYFGKLIDTYTYNLNRSVDQYLNAKSHHLTQDSISFNGDSSSGVVVRGSGYLNYIADYLTASGINPAVKITPMLTNFEVNLAYKMAGFSDQKYLQVLAEQSSPTSTNDSIIIPNENYEVYLHKSTPVTKIKYSAVIVERTPNGFSVRGYDLSMPYFTVIPSVSNNNFTVTNILGTEVKIYQNYQSLKLNVPYGYEFRTVQQVVDFLISYERFLQAQGFVFNDRNPVLGKIQNWKLSVEEFLFWVKQGWKSGSVLVLSPVVGTISGVTSLAIIDEVSDSQYGSKILDQNFRLVKNTEYTVYRAADNFKIQLNTEQIVGYIELDLVQYEHVLIFDNTTVFNDIIYKPELGNRQYRLKLIGQKTGDWDGSLFAPGFIYNSGKVDDWAAGRDYFKGELVKYKNQYYVALENIIADDNFDFSKWLLSDYTQIKKGLLPNFSSNALKAQSFYDSYGYFNDAETIKYSHGLIGFKPRQYLDDLGLNETTQIEFYKGYIKQKGSSNAIDALIQAQFNNLNSAIEFYEEWAIRVGEYGAIDENPYLEVLLDEKAYAINPALAEFVTNAAVADGVTVFSREDLYKATDSYYGNIALLRDSNSDYDNDIPTAGYVNVDDVDATIFDLADYKNLEDRLYLIGSGYTIWVAKDFQQRWNVFRITETDTHVISIENSLDGYIILESDYPHDLSANDIFMMRNFNLLYDGFYQVYRVLTLTRLMVKYTGDTTGLTTLEGSGIIFRLDSLRFQYMEDTRKYLPPHGWQVGEKVWIDDDAETTAVQGQPYSATNLWKVYERTRPYSLGQRLEKTNDLYITFSNVAVANTSATLTIGGNIVSNVSLTTGNAVGIIRNYDIYDANVVSIIGGVYHVAILNGQQVSANDYFVSNVSVSNVTTLTEYVQGDEFGRSIKMSDDTNTIVVGSPSALGNGSITSFDRLGSNAWVQSSTATPLGNNTSYFGHHIDLAINAVDGDYEYLAVGAPYSDKPGSANIGLVYIYNKTVGSNAWSHGQIISGGADGAGNVGDLFGYSFAFDEYGHWLYVGAPGNDRTYVYGLKRFVPAKTGTNTAPSSTPTITIPFAHTEGSDANAFVVTSNTRAYIPNIDFTVTGSVLQFASNIGINETLTISQGPYYKLVDVIDSINVGCNVGSEFGYAIDSSLDGAQLGVGAPGATVNVGIYTATINGEVRSVQKSIPNNVDTPTYVIDGNTYVRSSFYENVDAGSVYVIDRSIESFNSTEELEYNTIENISEVYKVLVDDIEVYPGTDFTKTGAKQITFNLPVGIGKVVTIETNTFSLLEKLISIDSLNGSLNAIQEGARFGTSFTICSNNCAFYVGAPYYNNGLVYNTGAVWKFHNKGRLYGTNFGYARNPVFTVGDTIRLDNFEVSITTPVDTLTIINSGNNYSQGTTITISEPSALWGIPATANLTANATTGVISSATLYNQGSGYTATPTVSIIKPGNVSVSQSSFDGSNLALGGSLTGVFVGMYLDGNGWVGTQRVTAVYPSVNIVTVSAANSSSISGTVTFFDRGTSANIIASISSTRSLDGAVSDINNAKVLGLTAVNENGYLRLVSDKTVAKNRLRILSGQNSPGSNGVYAAAEMAVFAFMQIIINPFNAPNEYFGTKVILARNAYMLLISSERGTTRRYTTFDNEATYFDAQTTGIYDKIKRSGSVYTYELYDDPRDVVEHPGRYQYCQQIDPGDLNPNDEFGAAIDIIGGYILVTSTKDDTTAVDSGSVYVFENPTGQRGWKLIRWQQPKVDIDSVSRLFLYNKVNNTILTNLEFIDPAKGKILGRAEQDITYKTAWDPAVYNSGTEPNSDLSTDIYWGQGQVGHVWWNLDKVRLIDYEQDNLTYRSINWGRFFPGSVIEVCEWVESNVLPSQYVAAGYDGVPLYQDDSAYVTSTFVDNLYVTQRYYFWVKDKVTLDAPNSIRTVPTTTIANLIENPKNNAGPYAAIIAPNALIVYNIASYLTATDTVLHVDYALKKNTNIIHSEYELLQRGNPNDTIPEKIINKLIDSLSGKDANGLDVPDPTLGVADRYGLGIRPRQSMFVDRVAALETAINWINNLFKDYPIARQFSLTTMSAQEPIPNIKLNEYDSSVNTDEELYYIDTIPLVTGHRTLVLNDTRLEGRWTLYELTVETAESRVWTLVDTQSYKTDLYWNYVDWYAAGYSDSTKPTYSVDTLVDAKKLPYAADDIIKVNNTGSGQWQLIVVDAEGNFNVIGIQNGTIELDSAKLLSVDPVPNTEIRYIITALKDDIFTGQLTGKFNDLLFVLVNYLFSEQKNIDWMFKTSFISVIHQLRGLIQFPNYIKDNQTYYEDYIEEVKPYSVKIREYLINYDGNDEFQGSVTDFDLPSYYDTTNKTFRSPSGELSANDQRLWSDPTGPYNEWYKNRNHSIESIIVAYGGEGYTSEPTVTIVSGNGVGTNATGAKNEFIITVDNSIGIYTGYKVTGSGIGSGATVTEVSGLNIILSVANSGTVNGPVGFSEFDFVSATARAIFNADTGTVTSINVISEGYGYDSTPVIIINGGCDVPARAYAVLKNNQVRSIGTTIKFDRISYTTLVKEWQANTAYAQGDIVSYNGTGYRALSNIPRKEKFISLDYEVYSSASFDNANDRIMAYYSPGNVMPAKDLGQLVKGIEYPGVQVQGLNFNQQPGFNGKVLVKLEFDSVISGTVHAGNVITQSGPDILITLSDKISANVGDIVTQRYVPRAANAVVFNGNGSSQYQTLSSTNQLYLTYTDNKEFVTTDNVYLKVGNNPLVFTMNAVARTTGTISNLVIGGNLVTGNAVIDSDKLYVDFVDWISSPNVATIKIGDIVTDMGANIIPTTYYSGIPRTVGIIGLAAYPVSIENVEDANITVLSGGANVSSVIGVLNSTAKFDTLFNEYVRVNGTLTSAKVANITIVDPRLPEYAIYADFNPYDTGLFDQVDYDEDGNPVISDWLLDSKISSSYTDSLLGLRPEDIDVDGGAYIDTYSSHAPEELIPGVLLETLDMQVYTKINANVDVLGYRIFNRSYPYYGNIINQTSFLRIADSYTTILASDLNITDTEIHVVDAEKLFEPDPSKATPGVVFINGERITYYTRNTTTNILGRIRRGTQSTGAANVHPAGTVVVDASVIQIIPNATTVSRTGVSSNIELILSNVSLATETTTLTINGNVVANASIISNSAIVYINTNLSSNVANILVGQEVVGANITAGTTVLGIENVYQATLTPSYKLKVNSNLTPKVGDIITQTTSGANALVIAADPILEESITLSGIVTANEGDYITQASTGTNVIVKANVTALSSVDVEYITGSFETLAGNLAINGVEVINWANVYSNSSWSNISSPVVPYIVSDRNITVLSYIYNDANVFSYSNVRIGVSGNITANIGDYITQTGGNANVIVAANVSNIANVTVLYNGLYDFVLNGGNIKINGTDANIKPIAAVANPVTINSDIYVNGTASNVYALYSELLGSVSATGNINITSNTSLITSNVWSNVSANSIAGIFEVDSLSEQILFLKAAPATYTIGIVTEDTVNIITTEDDIIIIEE